MDMRVVLSMMVGLLAACMILGARIGKCSDRIRALEERVRMLESSMRVVVRGEE